MVMKEEKIRFIEDACNSIRDEIQDKIMDGTIPEWWTSLEIRQLLVDKAKHERYFMTKMARDSYHNDIVTRSI